jgi:putative heme-binding domain-containing protein
MRSAALRLSVVLFTAAAFGLMLLPSRADRAKEPAATTTAPSADNSASSTERPFGIAERTPWTTSRIEGTPEPPPPYETRRVFPHLNFKNPVTITAEPTSKRLFVIEQQGKIYSFPVDPEVKRADLAIDLKKEIQTLRLSKDAAKVAEAYGLAFHPRFAENRYCYICYTLNPSYWGQLADGTRVSRFTVSETNPPRIDPASEQVVIDWLGGGHNGGCLAFGPDGCLYISSGDGGFPNPPDPRHTGQDVSDLLSSILRIDVDHEHRDAAGKSRPYAIPADNPFVGMAGARAEVWAFGLRNPWKISFDRATGDLWAGDVGWELWELADRVVRGGNYGWSVTEGRQPVYPDQKPGPSPVLPPTIAVPHTEGASITGGYVYRGQRYPELVGTYVFGDWESRRIWGAKVSGAEVEPYVEIALPGPRVVAFAEDLSSELLILDYDQGTLHELAPNPAVGRKDSFPTLLSETGLFANVAEQSPAPGVLGFSIQAEQWADYTTAERWIGLPGESTVVIHPEPVEVFGSMFREQFSFPKNGALAKTISLEMKAGDPASRVRLETQLLHFDGRYWRGYTYAWNDAQTDAALVDAGGRDRKFKVADAAAPGGVREQTWHFASRNECLLCHNPWAGFRLAFTVPQLNRDQRYADRVDNQLRALEHIGCIAFAPPKPPEDDAPEPPVEKPRGQFANPYDESADLNARARAWLHINCSHCHQFGAGGTADIELREEIPVEQTKTLEAQPKQGNCGIANVQILTPGDPYRSALYYRIAKMGRGRMPHIGSDLVDEPGVRLIHDWIRQLPVHKDDIAQVERLRSLDEATSLERERLLKKATSWEGEGSKAKRRLRQLAYDIAHEADRDKPTDADWSDAALRAEKEVVEAKKIRARDRVDTIRALLSSPTTALILERTFDTKPLSAALERQVLDAVLAHNDPQVRDLFERYVPPSERSERLGAVFDVAALLARPGDAARGRELYFNLAGVQCKNCHRIGEMGGTVGPELDHVGKKFDRAQMLESLLDPSKVIEPKYKAYSLQTTAGKTHVGQLVDRTADEVVLKDAEGKEIRVAAADVESLTLLTRSLMPDQLLRDMTPRQAADLLEYLESLK